MIVYVGLNVHEHFSIIFYIQPVVIHELPKRKFPKNECVCMFARQLLLEVYPSYNKNDIDRKLK